MQPNKYYLDRKQDKEMQKLLNRMGRLSDELANYGSYIMDYCSEQHTFTEYEVPIGTCFAQFLSLLDGISVLIKKGTSEPIQPLLRTMLEMKFNIEYMISVDDKKGILAYQVTHAQERINNWRMVDPSTQQGKEFNKKMQGISIDMSHMNPEEKIEQLERMLNREPFKEVNEEWKRTKKRKDIKGRPLWHNLYDGPKTIYDLSKYLDQESYYAGLYKDLSTFSHGSGTLGRIEKDSSGNGVNPGVRRVEKLPTDLSFISNFSLEIYRKLLGKYNPSKLKHFALWYENDIRKELFTLTNTKINVEYISGLS